MGWMEPPPLIRRGSSAVVGGGSPYPCRAHVAERHTSMAVPPVEYRTEAASRRFTRKLSLRPGWMDSQKPPMEKQENPEEAYAAALASLEGSPTTPTNPMQLPFQPSKPAELEARKAKRMTSREKRVSMYEAVPPKVQRVDPPEVQINVLEYNSEDSSPLYREVSSDWVTISDRHPSVDRTSSDDAHVEDTATTTPLQDEHADAPHVFVDNRMPWPSPLSETPTAPITTPAVGSTPELSEFASRRLQRQSAKRVSAFIEEDIPENDEMPMINFQNMPSQVDPLALSDTLAALEGSSLPTPQGSGSIFLPLQHHEASPASLPHEIADRRTKRTSVKRMSLFLEADIPEASEPAEGPSGSDIPPVSSGRKSSVVYALAALEQPTPTLSQVREQRQTVQFQHKAARARKTMSMYTADTSGPGVGAAAKYIPEQQRSYFEPDDADDDDDELQPAEANSRTRKLLKRMSWNVLGRAVPQLRQPDGTLNILDEEPAAFSARIQPPSARKSTRASWYPTSSHAEPSADPITAEWGRLQPQIASNKPWYSMDPSVAEIQCSPRREFGPPPPWLEAPVTGPAVAVQPRGAMVGPISPVAETHPSFEAPMSEGVRSPVETPVSEVVVPRATAAKRASMWLRPRTRGREGEETGESSKMARARFVGPSAGVKHAGEPGPWIGGGPVGGWNDPVENVVSRPATPVKTAAVGRMKKFGAQLKRIFR